MKAQCKAVLIFSLFIFSVGCKDDDSSSNFEKINTVTGISYFDENASAIGRWQFPNEKETDILLFPVPAVDVITLASQEPLKNVWVILGDCEDEDVGEEIPQMSQSLNYEVSEIEARQILAFTGTELSDEFLTINISSLDEGFYRMFFETELGEIFWKNFYKSNEPLSGQDIGAVLDNACE